MGFLNRDPQKANSRLQAEVVKNNLELANLRVKGQIKDQKYDNKQAGKKRPDPDMNRLLA
jgi:hypothetical protein